MTTVTTERDESAQALPGPAIPDLSLPQFVLSSANRRGSKRALVDVATGQEISYAGLADAVREIGAGLSARGLRPGDVLALCAPNSIEFAVAWFAAASIGAIVTTVNPQCTRDEIVRQLRQTGARWLVTTSGPTGQKLRGVTAETAITETIMIGDHAAGTIPFWSLRATVHAPTGPVSASDLALLPTSSGTTGLPKSVELTHRNLVASLCQTWLVHQVAEDDVVMAALPLFHIYGLQITLNLALHAGATVIILPRFGLDPFLRAVGLLALAWASPITGDFDGARREASASLAQLRGQDEPFWTAQASADLGAVEMATGRYDDALSHLDEMRDLAERFGYPWLAAWSQVLMGTAAIAQGRLDQARDLLEESLDQGLATNISSVAVGLIAFARLALADGDPGRAALLAAAAEGLRQRAGLQGWPVLRQGEAELVTQIREALGASSFDDKYAAGAQLSRRDAVAAARDRPGASTPA